MRILLAEDDVAISETICKLLEREGYFVDTTFDGDEAVYYAENESYDLIILDVMMPKKDGNEVIKHLRKVNIKTPTLILTAKDGVDDKVVGLDSGADDYMTKPFDNKELLARIRALTRRVGDVVIEEIKCGNLTLDINNYNLFTSEKNVALSKIEFDIMSLLMKNKNQVFSKDQLITKVWGYDTDTQDNNVEVYISFLRKKLKFLKSDVSIVNIRRVGYKITED